MATYAYIILASSTGSISKRFRIIESGYQIDHEKAQTENETLGGVDVSMGTIHDVFNYVVKVRHGRNMGGVQVEPTEYGIMSDLESLYDLNNPQGSPTNILTLTDHYGSTHSVYFVGPFTKKPICVMIEDGYGIFYMPIRLRKIPA